MATFPRVNPLYAADGLLRWKESVLLSLNTVGVAHVLSEDPPAAPSQAGGDGGAHQESSKKQWARDSHTSSCTQPSDEYRCLLSVVSLSLFPDPSKDSYTF
ncbi:unnamed protein product [Urochloa humidicola]